MIIKTSSFPDLENPSISNHTINFLLPNDIYLAKVFYTTYLFATPMDIPCENYGVCGAPFVSDVQLYRILSSSEIFSPLGTVNATVLSLIKPSNTNLIDDVQGIFLRKDGTIHHVYFDDSNQTVNLKDVQITGVMKNANGTMKFLFEFGGDDCQTFDRCYLLISPVELVFSDSAPNYLNTLFQLISNLDYVIEAGYLTFLDLPPDRMFLEIPVSESFYPVDILVYCEDEETYYGVAKLFRVSNSTLVPLFSYAQTSFEKVEDIQFSEDSGTLTLLLQSPLTSEENAVLYVEAGGKYSELSYSTIGNNTNTLYVIASIPELLEFAKENNSTTAEFYAYITNYKEGKYREGKLDFQPAEDPEVINTNSTQVTITWNPTNFDLCSTNLVEQVRDSGVTTTTVITNDGSDNVTLSSNATIYLFKTCPSLKKVIYKRFEVILQ
jgi:hypothetical protein